MCDTLIIGRNGQLGSTLLSLLPPATTLGMSHNDLDITEFRRVRTALHRHCPQLVINAAAYNLVNQAEEEPGVADAVNATGPRNLAIVCDEIEATLVHVSTDYVFSGNRERRLLKETDFPDPRGIYARSKLEGELFVQTHCERHFVVRTCGLYGGVAPGSKPSFVAQMLRHRDGVVSVVDDQWCTPTNVRDLAEAILALSRTERYGLYHATNSGATTWARFAEEIFATLQVPVEVKRVTGAELAAKASRPAWSVMDCGKLAGVIGWEMRGWKEALRACFLES